MPRPLLLSLLLLPGVGADAQWTERNSTTTQNLYAVHFPNDTGYAVGYYGTVVRSTDRGLSWATMPFPSTGNLHSTWSMDGLHGYVAGDSGLFRTADGGMDWEEVTTPVQQPWNHLEFREQLGYCGGGVFGDGTMLRTTDGGDTWEVVYSGGASPIAAIDMPDDTTVYAVVKNYSTGVLRSTDSGSTWNTVPIQPVSVTSNLEAVHFTDANTGYAGGWYLAAFVRTDDGGSTWTDADPEMAFDLYDLAFASPQNGLAVGWNGTIRHTYNGSDWYDENWPDQTTVNYAADMLDDTTAIVVGDIGRVLRWTSATAGVPVTAKERAGITVHPSPATDWLMLDSGAPLPVDARFELRDVQGRMVLDAAAHPNARMELGNIAPGSYAWRCAVRGSTWAGGTVVLVR
jgi:photosystem II stability/assembly factor-like uncharacterized protein